MGITWRELKAKLETLSEEELDDNATVFNYSEEEYYPIETVERAAVSDVLDEGHLVLVTCATLDQNIDNEDED